MLMLAAACLATVVGIAGYVAAVNGWVWIVEPWNSKIPPDKHILFLTDLWAHNASYAAGFIGRAVVIAKVWRSRLLERGRIAAA